MLESLFLGAASSFNLTALLLAIMLLIHHSDSEISNSKHTHSARYLQPLSWYIDYSARYLRNKPARSNIVHPAGTSIKPNVPYSSTGPYVFAVVLNVHACINANIPWSHRSVCKCRSLGAQYRAPLWLNAQEHKAASVHRDQSLGNGLCCSRFMTLCGLCCSRAYDLVYMRFECLLKYALCLHWISAPYFLPLTHLTC